MNRIQKFWKERPKGLKLCPNCQIIFNTSGFPDKDSWSCSEMCFVLANINNPLTPRDTASRLYGVLDLKPNYSFLLEPTQYVKKQPELKIETQQHFFATFGPLAVRAPEWSVKTHGGFMPDGTPLDDIKSVNEFWDHVAHVEGLGIMDLAQRLANTILLDSDDEKLSKEK